MATYNKRFPAKIAVTEPDFCGSTHPWLDVVREVCNVAREADLPNPFTELRPEFFTDPGGTFREVYGNEATIWHHGDGTVTVHAHNHETAALLEDAEDDVRDRRGGKTIWWRL